MPKIPPNDMHERNLNISNCQNRYGQRSTFFPAYKARILITTKTWKSADIETQFLLEIVVQQSTERHNILTV
jgi:hypothetical protein